MRVFSLSLLTGLTICAFIVHAGDGPVSFAKEIQPIFQASCWKCHGAAIQLSKLDLRNRESALRGGEHGPAMAPGKADESRLYRMIAGLEKPSMPPDSKLTAEQVAAIKAWIDQGAVWEDGKASTQIRSTRFAGIDEPPELTGEPKIFPTPSESLRQFISLMEKWNLAVRGENQNPS